MSPACSGVNVRRAATTSSTIAVTLGATAALTVSGTVSGAAWGTSCPTWKSGRTWYVVTAINGVAVSSRYGAELLYAATGVLKAAPISAPTPPASASPKPTASTTASSPATATQSPAATATSPNQAAGSQTLAAACSGVNVRRGATTSATIAVKLGPSDTVTSSGTVSGRAWGTTCPTWKAGSGWYVITAINGASVASRFGVSALYAATGTLKATAIAATPSPVPTATPRPSATAAPAPTGTPTGTPIPTATPVPTPAPAATPAPAGSPALVPACSSINLRASATTSSTIVTRLGPSARVTVSGITAGASWSTSCPTAKAGSGWYTVTEVNGTSVRTLYGVSVVYAATGILTTPLTATAPVTGVVALGPSTAFFGRGYGHGVGLSQYGARGRAIAGQTAAQILAHYYQGTTIGTIAAGAKIWVLVLNDLPATSAAPLTIAGHGGTWSVSGVVAVFPADATLRLWPSTAGNGEWQMTVTSVTGAIIYAGAAPASARVVGSSAATTLQLASKPTGFDLYRGVLRWVISGSSADVVNELPLEDYLRGVVPAEMPSTWPVEARLAQTIAARSYAAYRLHPTTGTFDVYDDTRSQVYRGVHAEMAAADATISATANQILRSGTSIVNALFHSTGGGATEDNENVFVSSTGAKTAGPVGYLRGSSDRDPGGAAYDAAAPYATWQTGSYTVAQLSSIFGADSRSAVGILISLDLSNRGVSGRLISITLNGTAGSRTVSGQLFVDIFNAHRPAGDAPLRSTLLSLSPIS